MTRGDLLERNPSRPDTVYPERMDEFPTIAILLNSIDGN